MITLPILGKRTIAWEVLTKLNKIKCRMIMLR